MYNKKKSEIFWGWKNGLDRHRSLIAEGHIDFASPVIIGFNYCMQFRFVYLFILN